MSKESAVRVEGNLSCEASLGGCYKQSNFELVFIKSGAVLHVVSRISWDCFNEQ